VPYYATNRDLSELPNGGSLVVYSSLTDVLARARHDLAEADLALTTSYCPDAVEASALILESRAAVRAFYDLDTPVTLDRLGSGMPVDYIPPGGLQDFDLVLSFTGGRALSELERLLGARRVVPLYGSVDPGTHFPVSPVDEYRADLSYLGTYAADRQPFLEELFIQPAREQAWRRFVMGGALYPHSFPWTPNIFFVRHMPPPLHPRFFCSSRATLNITRKAMADRGYCPSGRLFEAAACGVPILSDVWDGLDTFFTPGEELLPVRCSADVIAALERSDEELARIARHARERTLCEHTADERIKQLEAICAEVGAANGQVDAEIATA
jgi:spore maturation protein CgeB